MRNRLVDWMKLVVLIASAALTACGTWSPGPGGAPITVVGRGDPALDVPAVQNAVDQGGTVLLKGAFDFGDKGNVTLTRDVAVIGEAGAAGKPVTTIKGGYATLRSLRPDGASGPGPKIAIRHIHFDGASWMPIQLTFASAATISGNLVTRVKPVVFAGGRMSGGKPFNMQHGVVIGGVAVEPDKPFPYQEGAVTGRVTIADNDFDLASDAPTNTVGMAVFMVHTTGINAEIARNRIRNVPRNGIEVIDNYRGPDGSGKIVITDNDIETPVQGTPIPSPRTPNGILAGYFLKPEVATDEKRAVSHMIVRNKVRVRGQTPSSWGIAVMTDRAIVMDNHVTLQSPGALGITVSGSHNRVDQNRIDGSGTLGIGFGPYPPMKASNNELVNNDLSKLKTSRGEIGLAKGANQNRIAGSTGRVADAGEGNVTDGLTPFVEAAK